MEQKIIQTEQILFNYFKHIKIYKYFMKGNTPQSHCKNHEILDISHILNSMNMPDYMQDVILYYGLQFKRPNYHGRYRSVWNTAIKNIAIEFEKKGIIK